MGLCDVIEDIVEDIVDAIVDVVDTIVDVIPFLLNKSPNGNVKIATFVGDFSVT